MSATMGYAGVAELSHELETVLDAVRAGARPLDAELLDLCFRAADLLEMCLDAAVGGRDGAIATAWLVQRLRAVSASASDARSSERIAAPPGAGTVVRVTLAPNTPLRGVRAFLVVNVARGLGEVTAIAPALEELQSEQFDREFVVRIRTEQSDAEIERAIRSAGDVAHVQIGEDRRDALPGRASSLLTAIDAGAETIPVGSSAARRHVRVDLRRLDALMNLIGELVVARGRLQACASSFANPELTDCVADASRLILDLRDEITASRMVPAWQVFDRFPRVVRDLAHTLGKELEFSIDGKDIELDRSMLDEIADSLVHLLRNAIDHGIETPAERLAAGKPPTGRLRLSAARERSAAVIRVTDDGRGIDRRRVLARAREDGLVGASTTELSDEELFHIITRPGFSTADQITDVSGRGVGFDVVHTRARGLGGAMDIKSVAGEGTSVMLRLPLTLAIVRAVLTRVADETYAIPAAHVSESVELNEGSVCRVQGRDVIRLRGDLLPLVRLRRLVGLPPHFDDGTADLELAIIVDLGDRFIGIAVDDVIGQDEIVVKPFDSVRDGLTIFGGATLLADGSPALIMDVSCLG